MRRILIHSIFFISILGIQACENIFEFSPFAAKVNSKDRNQTEINLNKLLNINTTVNNAFSFFTIADTHYEYHTLDKAISKINDLQNTDFVIHLGDMADHGWLKEFELFNESMRKLQIPYLTAIGNHDHLANGEKIYRSMFGPNNYTVEIKNTKLVFFDATTWESDKQGDVVWLENELGSSVLPKILISHIPLFDEQISETHQHLIKSLIQEHNVILTLHGHYHTCESDKLWDTNVDYIIPGSIDKRKLFRVNVEDGKILTTNHIDF